MTSNIRRGLFALLAAALFSSAALADGGRVLVVQGDAWILRDGDRLRVEADTVVYEGDVIATGPGTAVKWRMQDDSIYTLGSNSRLRVREYKIFRGQQRQRQGIGKLTLDLLRGGFRSITGFIGSRNRSAYTVRTPVATMGVRGTDYTMVFLDPVEAERHGLEPGLYVQVRSGAVVLNNPNGTTEVKAGQVGFVALDGAVPEITDEEPPSGREPVLIPGIPAILQLFSNSELQFGVEFFQALDVQIEIRIEPEAPASPS